MNEESQQPESPSADAPRDNALLFVNMLVNEIDALLKPKDLTLSWAQKELEDGGISFQFILEDAPPAIDPEIVDPGERLEKFERDLEASIAADPEGAKAFFIGRGGKEIDPDEDLGELDPSAACRVDNPECESCQ